MKTRSKERAPIWEAKIWLNENYIHENGLPGFFKEGGYVFTMKQIAEEDYINMVKSAALQEEDQNFKNWGNNMKLNDYRVIQLATNLEYWRYLAEKEQIVASRDKAAGISLTDSSIKPERRIKKHTNQFISKDTFFIEGYRESFGTIIGRFVRSYISNDNKSSYFKTLAMNNIMDISDDSEGSHLDQICPDAQIILKKMLTKVSFDDEDNQLNHDVFEDIVQKFALEENDDIFLNLVIKEADEAKSDKLTKRVYLQILETMLYDKYVFAGDECSEADYIVKLYGPIMENLFRGSGCRLIWGDTKSPFCMKESNEARLDLRIVSSNSKSMPDLCVSEYAKKAIPWKYYKDKTKTVIASFIHLKHHIKKNCLSLEEVKLFVLPFVICEGLEADVYTIRLVSEDWCIIEKYNDMDLPCSVDDVKKGNIAEYLNCLKKFKRICLNTKSQAIINAKKNKGIHVISKKPLLIDHFLQKNLWVDPFDGQNTDCDD